MSRPPVRDGGRRIDLHAHTTFSDGLLTPAELVQRAIERQLLAVAVTDHDTVAGVAPARVAAQGALEVVPGIEISSAQPGFDLHILGYFVDIEDTTLRERLVRFREERLERALEIVRRLAELGAPVEAETVLALAGPGVVGRPHVAEALVRAGHVESSDEAFRRFLGARGEAFVPRPAFRPADALALIHAAGGVSVLAHAGPAMPDAIIENLAAEGLQGLEVWHPQHGPSTVRRYRTLAARLGLLETGGSDFHGPGRSLDLGDIAVPASALGPLKRAAGVAG
jgi:predicted metal-dependent phosphoesterase TrpH